MARKVKSSESTSSSKKIRPALTPEARENIDPLFYRHGLRRKNLFVLQTCLSALVINYYKYFFITVKLRAIAVRNVLRQPLILPCSTCEAVRNFRYQRSCCRQII